jgi:hypothetical protein
MSDEEKQDELVSIRPSVGGPRYSQPLQGTLPAPAPVVRVTRGRGGKPVFVFNDERGREIKVEATRENSAVEKPRGFARAFARMFWGNR